MSRNDIIDMNELFYCKYCDTKKNRELFNKSLTRPDKIQNRCRECEKKYRLENKERRKISKKNYGIKNKEQIKNKKREYYINNKEKINKRNKNWAINNKEAVKIQRHKKYLRTKEKTIKQSREWRANNIDRSREYQRNWTKHKRKTDPCYAIGQRLRKSTCGHLKAFNLKKDFITLDTTGMNLKDLKAYLESKFTEGMTWEKFLNSEIEIDHIKPCCSFDLTKPEEQKKCFHYSNLQPLWKRDNRKKLQEDLKLKIDKKNSI